MLRKQTAPSLSGPDCPAALIPAIRPLPSVSLGHSVVTRGDPRPSACMPVRQPRETTRSVWKWLCGQGGRRARPGDLASGQVLSRKLNPCTLVGDQMFTTACPGREESLGSRRLLTTVLRKLPARLISTDHSDLAEGRHVVLQRVPTF